MGIKIVFEIFVKFIPSGVTFGIIEGDTITWKKSSNSFDMDIFSIGENLITIVYSLCLFVRKKY